MRTNISLIGFMGSGKTSSGIMAAKDGGYDFIETDYEVEKRLGKNISDIFAEYGENYFRDVESLICEDIGKKQNAIISTGGGIIKRAENIKNLKKNGIIIYLSAQASHLYNNLKNDTKRPLLQSAHGHERLTLIERMLSERCAAYDEYSDAVIDVTDKTLEQISKEILIIGGNK